jgi:ABC-type phosphate transport system substrate-binding protein
MFCLGAGSPSRRQLGGWKGTLLIVGGIFLLAAAACGGGTGTPTATPTKGAPVAGKTITIKGSDTMVILGQRWAEEYQKLFPSQSIQVNGGGSGTGIAALINGSTDIAQSSRPMKDTERQQAESKTGRRVLEIAVALDGVAVFVHRDNPLKLEIMHLLDCATNGVARNISVEEELYSLEIALKIINMMKEEKIIPRDCYNGY